MEFLLIVAGSAGTSVLALGGWIIWRLRKQRRGAEEATPRSRQSPTELDRIWQAQQLIRSLRYALNGNDPTHLALNSLGDDLSRYETIARKQDFVPSIGPRLTELIEVLDSLHTYIQDSSYMTNSWLSQQRSLFALKRELLYLAGVIYKGTRQAVQQDQARSIGTRELVAERQQERRIFGALGRK